MPIVSGGGGGGPPFNGGTITGALTVNPSDATAHGYGEEVQGTNGLFVRHVLDVLANAAASGAGMLVNTNAIDAGDGWQLVDSGGNQRARFNGTVGLELQDNGGNVSLRAQPDGTTYLGLNFASRILPAGAVVIGQHAAPADAALNAGDLALWFDQTNAAAKLMTKAKQADGTVVAPGLTGRDIATAPAVSAASTLALGTAYQNTLGYDVLLCVYLSVTVNTSGVLKLGVGPTTTPTQQTLVTGITSTGLWPVPIYLPNQYYALLSVTGTITVAVDGQIAMPV